MSLLFGLVAKHYVEEGDTVRFCSYPRQTPYTVVHYSFSEDESNNIFSNHYLFNLRSEKVIKITDKCFIANLPPLVTELHLLGTSRGWEFIIRLDDSIIILSDVYNPWSSESSIKTIALPPLLYTGDIIVSCVSLSTPFPDQDNDYIVSVHLFGSKLYYCMPNKDSEWTQIYIPFSSDPNPRVVYSRTDQMFYLLTTGGSYMAALDLKNNKKPRFLQLQFENFPLLPQYEWEVLDSCSRHDFIVESSSGERFIVQWFVIPDPRDIDGNIHMFLKTKQFMVFRTEENKLQGRKMIARYTENIGDLSIFIGHNETFCLEASKYPGLRPNFIYYVGHGFGVYDISNRSTREYDLSVFPEIGSQFFILSPPLH